MASLDYRIYHAVNTFVSHHSWLGRTAGAVGSDEVVFVCGVLALAAALLLRWEPWTERVRIGATAAVAGASAYGIGKAIAAAWTRQPPFATHPGAHVWGQRAAEGSFPSDHTSLAFAVAAVVTAFDARVGSIFVAAAALIGIDRLLAGAHYPTDILGGCAVGVASGAIFGLLARRGR